MDAQTTIINILSIIYIAFGIWNIIVFAEICRISYGKVEIHWKDIYILTCLFILSFIGTILLHKFLNKDIK